MRRIVLLAVLCVSSCATTPTYVSQQDIAQSYRPYAGQPVDALFPSLGAPSGTMVAGASKVYVWHGTAQWVGNVPVTTTRRGTVSTGNAMDGPGVQYSERSTRLEQQSSDLACDLQVFVDSQERIQNVMVRGQNGACQQFLQ